MSIKTGKPFPCHGSSLTGQRFDRIPFKGLRGALKLYRHFAVLVLASPMLCLDFMSSSWLFSPQVRERLRVALERVSMLEDQLAASSQEVKFSTDDSLSLRDARMFGVKRNEKKTTTFICIVCLPILSPPFQVISLRDQIKRRQQGVDGGKDVREGFMHVGSSCFFCICVSVRRNVDVWVPWW